MLQPNAELWEPYDGRLSRTVLREREGEVPSRHSPVSVKNGGHLSFPRARNTWLSAHLRAGTDLPDLARFSRPVKTDTLTALLKIIARDIDPMEAALRGLKA